MNTDGLIRGIPSIAEATGLRPGTLRYWLDSADKRAFWRLNSLIFRDPSGRWCSTPRRVREWLVAIQQRAA